MALSKQQQQYIALGGLVLILVIVMIVQFRPQRRPAPPKVSRPKQPEVVPEDTPQITRPTAGGDATSAEIEAQLKRAQADWGIDPFYHARGTQDVAGSSLQLKGVSLGRNKTGYAFINDEIVTEGDVIYGYKIVAVEMNKVLLKRGLESFYLVLPEQ